MAWFFSLLALIACDSGGERNSDELDGGLDADAHADADHTPADADTETDAETDAEADAERDDDADVTEPPPCGGECDERVYSACTCAAVDPCRWEEDGVCDGACREVTTTPGDRFDDLVDCDDDRDGLFDDLEAELALRFEPYLWLSPREEGFRDERLPHFAVEPRSALRISVYYALSYFRDYGDPDLAGASSHDGDSEFIVVDLVEIADGEWEVERVFLSAHHGTWTDASRWFLPAELSFHEDSEGHLHPVAYVSEWKHANYRSLAECDLGSLLTDHCEEGTLEPVGIAAERNIGNPDVQLFDEVAHASGREYYFSRIKFCGWRVASIGDLERFTCSSAYRGKIDLWLDGTL